MPTADDDVKSVHAEQIKKRSLSSHCRKRSLDAPLQQNVLRQLILDKANTAYMGDKKVAIEKRLRNFQKFVNDSIKETAVNPHQANKGAISYALNYLDKLAQ